MDYRTAICKVLKMQSEAGSLPYNIRIADAIMEAYEAGCTVVDSVAFTRQAAENYCINNDLCIIPAKEATEYANWKKDGEYITPGEYQAIKADSARMDYIRRIYKSSPTGFSVLLPEAYAKDLNEWIDAAIKKEADNAND